MSFGGAAVAVLSGPLHHTFGVGPDIPLLAQAAALEIGCVSGLLPDLDEPNAMLARGGWLPRAFGPIVRLLAMIVSLPLRLFGYLLKGTLGHRGGTHSLAMAAAFTLFIGIGITMLFGVTADWAIWAVLVGCLSHLVADMLNPSGVPLLWPMLPKDRTLHLLPSWLRIPTESPPNYRERTVNFGVRVGTCVLWGFYHLAIPLVQHRHHNWIALAAAAFGMVMFWIMTVPAKQPRR